MSENPNRRYAIEGKKDRASLESSEGENIFSKRIAQKERGDRLADIAKRFIYQWQHDANVSQPESNSSFAFTVLNPLNGEKESHRKRSYVEKGGLRLHFANFKQSKYYQDFYKRYVYSKESENKKHLENHMDEMTKFCHYFNNFKVCPYEEFVCQFKREESDECTFQGMCRNRLWQYRHHESERKAKEVAEFRKTKDRETKLQKQQAEKMDNFFSKMEDGEISTVNVLIKSDVRVSAQALVEALEELSTDEVKVKVVSSGVGAINNADISLASASEAIVLGFNVRADAVARNTADTEGVRIEYYSIIYNLIDDIKAIMGGMLSPELSENIIGIAGVKDVFRSPKFGDIAGCMVEEGVVRKDSPIRVLRESVVIYEGELESLRRFKDDVKEVKSGTECGIGVLNYTDVQPGDQIEVFERIERARSL